MTDCEPCGGSGWVRHDRGCGVWEDRQCPPCDGTGKVQKTTQQTTLPPKLCFAACPPDAPRCECREWFAEQDAQRQPPPEEKR